MTRICRTIDEVAQAAREDSVHDRPIDRDELTRLVALWAPVLRQQRRDEEAA